VSNLEIGLVSIVTMVALIYIGLYVPIALAATSFVGVWALKGNAVLASKLLALAAAESISNYIFGVVPLFVLMGLLVSVADIGRNTFEVANQWFRRVRGGLGVATVTANAIFASITGISIASAAVFTRVAVPEMVRYGYRPRFAVGLVAGSSVLGMLIPPSLLLILYGVIAEQSVGDLFIAGVIPGILLSLAFAVAIVLMARHMPSFVGGGAGVDDELERMDSLTVTLKMAPIVVLVGLVLGGIYAGWFTPTEAGAVGAMGALLLALMKRKLSLREMWRVLVETGHVTASICFLIIAATMYTRMLSISGVPGFFGSWIQQADLGFYAILTVYVVVLLLMGTILDSSSILMIAVPLALPIMEAFDTDLIWFGIVTIIAVEVGLLTPPLGLSAYVIKGTLEDDSITLNDIFAGAFPFAVIMVLVLVAIIAVPWLSLALL